MRLAANADRVHAAGAELIAISVDEPARQAGMRERWKLEHQLLVSDPAGERYLQALDLYDPQERDGIALPGLLVIDPEGREVYRYAGRDFADRTTDDAMFEALEALSLPAVDPPTGGPDGPIVDELRGFFPVDAFGPYYRGNMFGALAIAGRISDPASAEIAKQHRRMAKQTLDAWATLSG